MNRARRTATTIILASLLTFGAAGTANAANADTGVSAASDSGTYVVVKDGNTSWRQYGGQSSMNNTVDYVYVPAGIVAYHYYNGRLVEVVTGARTVAVGGAYTHVWFLYWN